MGNCEAMTSSTRSFAYSYQLVKKCFLKICETSKCHNFLIFQPIFIRFSLFYSQIFTLSYEIRLNLFRISPLNTTKTHDMINTILIKPHTRYTGWPRTNATPTITNFKEIRDYIKLVSALMSRIFFFQQNDTKINDFDEGILLRQCHFQNLLLLYQKSRLR